MPNPKTDPATLHTQTWITQGQGFSPIHRDAASIIGSPVAGWKRQSVTFGVKQDSAILHLLTLWKQPGW